jgi:hypothetical protein
VKIYSFHLFSGNPLQQYAYDYCAIVCRQSDGQWRRTQAINKAQDLSKQGAWDGDFRQLEGDVATMADSLGANLDQILPQRGQRPVLYFTLKVNSAEAHQGPS